MKTLNVVAAIIHKDNKILATKRGYGEFINQWEFPGGKIEENETKEEALIREIKEELNVEIEITNFALDLEYQYPTFYLKMSCYDCIIKKGTPKLLEHNDARWLSKDELDDVNWIPADIAAVDYLKETMVDHLSMMEKMKKVDEEMQKCGYDLDRLKELYENTDDRFERQLIYAEIRSIEILNSIQIDANGE
ncbi:(deoxy)nucleoside triphosphate pyrophosphohydrolase [uncultured Methanobrevibacter sp.]|uniref:(deoxy)nucleoside triphosphate pyrophosphohydrolase n=1 Tax=uncultured Methanobrevibacter sp. TaxID=253161 RepID=UPI0025E5F9FC|nr:(deoxy)nucleoside triphosphate pyrophosphohydrolase [uncultured Methanobrevibacter sp.]